jgi:copper homeostasis protein
MTPVTIEVAIESVDDAKAAYDGGADRLELCAALDLGGLTPSIGQIERVIAATPLPVMVMIRPRGGDFVYDDHELAIMNRDIEVIRTLRPMGFVFGVLTPDALIHKEACRKLLDTVKEYPCTFHRAFDRANDNRRALEEIIDLGFARVLSSGLMPTAIEGVENLRILNNLADGRIHIVPCGRVRSENAAEIVRIVKSKEIHGSFAEAIPASNELGREGYILRSRTSRESVRKCRDLQIHVL